MTIDSGGVFRPPSLLQNLSIDGADRRAGERSLSGPSHPRQNVPFADRIKQFQAVALLQAADRQPQPRSLVEQAKELTVHAINVIA